MEKTVKKYQKAQECPITLFMTHIGGKWKPVILWLLLLNEVMRFSELNKAINGISQKMLSQQLKTHSTQILSRYPTQSRVSLNGEGQKLKKYTDRDYAVDDPKSTLTKVASVERDCTLVGKYLILVQSN